MWNLLCANNILEKRIKYKAHLKHLQALRSVRPTINNKSPLKPVFLATKQKGKQLELEKKYQIQNNNNILVDHMQKVQTTIGNDNSIYERVKALSYRRPFKKRQQKQIDQGNELMIKKLQNVSSEYKTHSILKQTEDYLMYKYNIMTSSKPTSTIYNASFMSTRNRPFSAKYRPASAPKRM